MTNGFDNTHIYNELSHDRKKTYSELDGRQNIGQKLGKIDLFIY